LFLKNESKLNEQLADKENQGKNYAFAGIGLLLVSGEYIFYLFSKKRRLSNKLSTSLVELKQAQSQLIALEKEKEAEAIRLRISRDIHDDIGSNLTKISMLGNLAVAEGVNNTPELTAHLYKISDYARNVNRSMSEIIWAVNPGQDTLENLFTYMKVHALDFLNNSGTELQINFPHENIDYQLNPDLKRSLFLTLKECLNNAIKYSGATLITINFQVYNAHFEFKISDNGKGFDPNNIAAGKGGNGLINLEIRLKAVGCTFSVVSKPQQGCTIIVKGTL
jgi:signal transduction histidine kinase